MQNILLSIDQLLEDRQYVRYFLASNTNSNYEADFEYVNDSISENVCLSVIRSITDPILRVIMTALLFLLLFWFVVLTILASKYFIRIGFVKIRDREAHA